MLVKYDEYRKDEEVEDNLGTDQSYGANLKLKIQIWKGNQPRATKN